MAKKRGFLAGRNEYDTLRMARTFLDEFRAGKLGRITLELPPEA
jgi:ribosome biogenesis GTPase A